jgi:hypothetical protein
VPGSQYRDEHFCELAIPPEHLGLFLNPSILTTERKIVCGNTIDTATNKPYSLSRQVTYVVIRLVQFHLLLTQEKSLLTTIYAFNRATKLIAKLPRGASRSRSSPGQRKTSVFDGETSRVHLYFPAGQLWGSIGCARVKNTW